jgi:hypothetical protein
MEEKGFQSERERERERILWLCYVYCTMYIASQMVSESSCRASAAARVLSDCRGPSKALQLAASVLVSTQCIERERSDLFRL